MKRNHAEELRRIIKDFLPTLREFVYIAILTCVFTFLSFIGHVRTVPGEKAGFVDMYFGFPLEWFRMSASFGSWYSTLSRHEILWSGFAVDVTIFVLLSIVLVRMLDKFTDYMSFTFFKRVRNTHA